MAAALVLYVAAALALGSVTARRPLSELPLIPGGRSDFSPEHEQRFPLILLNNGVHVDMAVPAAVVLDNGQGGYGLDWRRLFPLENPPMAGRGAFWCIIGWGQREFYMTTPHWTDLRPGTAIRALLGAPSALHVEFYAGPLDTTPPEGSRVFMLSARQYLAFYRFVEREAVRDAQGRAVRIPVPGYGPWDGFFEASSSFNAFATCNVWAARALSAAGLPAPLWTPFSFMLIRHV